MSFTIKCPNLECAEMVAVDEMFAGGQCPCPKCGTIIVVSLPNLKASGPASIPVPPTPIRLKKAARLLPSYHEKIEEGKRHQRRTDRIRRELDSMYPPPEKGEEDKPES